MYKEPEMWVVHIAWNDSPVGSPKSSVELKPVWVSTIVCL